LEKNNYDVEERNNTVSKEIFEFNHNYGFLKVGMRFTCEIKKFK